MCTFVQNVTDQNDGAYRAQGIASNDVKIQDKNQVTKQASSSLSFFYQDSWEEKSGGHLHQDILQ